MSIDWWTLGLQAVNFLVLVWLLHRLLFRPVREVIAKRKAAAAAALDAATKAKADAEAAQARYEADRAQLARDNAAKLRDLHRQAEDERARIVAAAQAEAERIAQAGRAAIAGERAAAVGALRSEAAAIAAAIAGRLLREAGPAATSDAFLAALEKRFHHASEEERDRLRRDLAQHGTLEVVTAAALSAADEARWRARLTELLGPVPTIGFAADPALIGGAELRFPHAVLGSNWRDQIERAKQAVSHDPAAA
jgi:F-type H+-transporting ATPase subunit b